MSRAQPITCLPMLFFLPFFFVNSSCIYKLELVSDYRITFQFVYFIRLNIKKRHILIDASNLLLFVYNDKFMIPLIRLLIICSTRHHARRSPSTGGCHTHASHSHTSTPGNSPLHAPAGLLSPHRAVPTSHMGQTIACGAHRLSLGGSTANTIAGNGSSPTSQSVPTPTPALANVGIELNEVQPGKFNISAVKSLQKVIEIGKKCYINGHILYIYNNYK